MDWKKHIKNMGHKEKIILNLPSQKERIFIIRSKSGQEFKNKFDFNFFDNLDIMGIKLI